MEAEGRGIEAQLTALLRLPGVPAAVEDARDACTRLRWHQALRRRTAEGAAESRVRGATASAALEGAEPAGSHGSLDLVRDLVRGAVDWPLHPDPLTRTVRAAVRVTAATEFLDASSLEAPSRLLAGLHVAAGADLLPAHLVGRPRKAGETCAEMSELGPAPGAEAVAVRLDALRAVLQAAGRGSVPTLLVAAVAHAEVATVRPFVSGNGLVARALERVLLRVGGLDPTGVAVPEAGHRSRAGADYRGGLAAYATGGMEGVRLWVLHCAQAVVAGAGEGTRIADAVLAGRLGDAQALPNDRPKE